MALYLRCNESFVVIVNPGFLYMRILRRKDFTYIFWEVLPTFQVELRSIQLHLLDLLTL